MRGTLEVALKAYLIRSYQHCTDEAQEISLILFGVQASVCWIVAQKRFNRSIVSIQHVSALS